MSDNDEKKLEIRDVGRVYQIQQVGDSEGPRYIGSTTTSLEERMSSHKCDANGGKEYPLYAFMRDNGVDNFEIKLLDVIHDVTDDLLCDYEQKQIDYFDSVRNGLNGKNATRKCEHKSDRRRCVKCDGSALCKHEKQLFQCKECGGNGFCEHEKQKSRCLECDGASTCPHGKTHKDECSICNPCLICKGFNITAANIKRHRDRTWHTKSVAKLAALTAQAAMQIVPPAINTQ